MGQDSSHPYTANYFQIEVSLNFTENGGLPSPSQILLNTTYLPVLSGWTKINETDDRTLINKKCILYGGIVAYDLLLQNETVKLAYDDYSNDTFIEKM